MPIIYAGSGDGRIVGPTSTTWAGARDAATGAGVNTSESYNSTMAAVARFASRGGGNTYRVYRSYFTFAVGSITEQVVDVVFNVYGYGGNDGSIWGVKGGLVNAGGLAVSQFDDIDGFQTGTVMPGNVTAYTDIIAGAGWNVPGENSFQGTSSLMSDIETASVITLVLTDYTYDARNTAPTSNGTWNCGGFYTNNTGTAKDPHLDIKLAGYGHEVNTVVAASIGKVNTVETGNIGKIITVD
jgi:hypothetical protein